MCVARKDFVSFMIKAPTSLSIMQIMARRMNARLHYDEIISYGILLSECACTGKRTFKVFGISRLVMTRPSAVRRGNFPARGCNPLRKACSVK